MKKLNEILSHLKKNPEFRKINTQEVIVKIINLLPVNLKKGVKFAYIKNQYLYFVLTHPVYKMEFEYNKGEIKSLLRKYNLVNVDDVKFFVTNRIEKKIEVKEYDYSFNERSFGIFENKVTDETLHAKIEGIRSLIKKT